MHVIARLSRALGMVVLATALASPVLAGSPQADDWGWAVVRRADESYTLAPKDGRVAGGAPVEVSHTDEGEWTVTFEGAQLVGATAHVTPLTATPAICTVESMGPFAGQWLLGVRCFDRLGHPKDVPFVASVLAGYVEEPPERAYAWADQPGEASYTPDTDWQFNSASELNLISRLGVGTYRVRMPGVGASGGNVQVTAFGTDPVVCRTAGWQPSGGTLLVDVLCRDESGALVDSRFNVSYVHDAGLKGDAGRAWAYLRANRPRADSYVPDAAYRDADPAAKPRITRVRRGLYSAKLPEAPLGGAAHVTAYGAGSARCVVSSIRKRGLPQRIGVRCFTADGSAPADSRFTLSYLR